MVNYNEPIAEDEVTQDVEPENQPVEKTEEPESVRDVIEEAFEESTGEKATDLEPSEEQGEVKEEVSQEEAVSPPDSWSKKDREVFSQLPKEAQEVIFKRDREAHNYLSTKINEITQYKKELDGYLTERANLEETLETFKSDWDGVSDHEHIQAVLSADRAIMSGNRPLQIATLNKIIRSVGLDPEDLLDEETESQVDNEVYQSLEAIQRENEALKQQFQSQRMMATTEKARSFAFEKNEQGEFLRPYLHNELLREQLLTTMTPRINQLEMANPNANLYEIYKQAYEEAIWAIPQIREQLITEVPAKNGASKKTPSLSRKLSTSIKGSSAQPVSHKDPTSIREALELAWEGSS